MGVEERMEKGARFAIAAGVAAVGLTFLLPCNDSDRVEVRMRDECSPAGTVEQMTMNVGEKYEPAVYVGPTIRAHDGSGEEMASPIRHGKNPWFYLRP